MSAIPHPPPDLPEVSGNKSQIKRPSLAPNYNNNNGLSPNKSSETDSSSNTSSKNATPSHPTTQTDRSIVSERSPTSKPGAPPTPTPQEARASEGGEKEKVWERCWSLGELKQGSSAWTLASDAGLLKYLQDFSMRVTKRTYEISSQVDGVSLESQSSCGRLENVSNKFHKLSMEQFMENRVFDEDETDHTRTESTVSDAAPSEEDREEADSSGDGKVLERANHAVMMGLGILENAFDQVNLPIDPDSDSSGDDADIERSTILPTELEPKDLYLLRPFPSLIGSATFYETDHLGLRLQESSESEGVSDAYESERESSGTETEVKQKQRQKGGAEGTRGLAEDAGDSSGDLFSEGESTKAEKKKKGGDTPPLEEGGLFNTKQGKFDILNRNKSGDEGNLFDSSSEDEDLFSEGPKKKKEPKQPKLEQATEPVSASATGTDTEEPKKEKKKKKKKRPAGAIAVFGMLDSEDSDGDDESEGGGRTEKFGESVSSTVSAPSKDTLFDSDSEEDLFSTHKPTKPKDKTTAAPKQQKQEATPVENDVESHKEKSRFGGDSLNFEDSDSDSDMDLFEKAKTDTSSAVKMPVGAVKIFAGLDDAVLMGRGSTPPSKKETTPPIAAAKSEKEKVVKQPSQTKGMSLYENSSSEDDLFSSMSQARETSKIVKKEEPSKPSSTNVKVPDQDQALGSPPPVTRSQLIANGLKFLDGSDEDSGDDLFSKPTAVKSAVSSAKESQPTRATDSPILRPVAAVETDELFSGVASGDTQMREDQDLNTESNLAIPETKPKETKSEDLFALGSDSDEDLFSLGTTKTVKAPEKKIAEQSSKPPDPVQSKATGHGGLFSENDELFSAIQSTPDSSLLPTTSRPPKPPSAADLFSEEPDEDDLFSGPASLDLFSGTKPNAPSTASKPKPAKATLPSLFAPIDTGADEGSIFEQPAFPTGEHEPLSMDLPPQHDDTPPPPLTKPPAGNPETLLPTQQNNHERDNAIDTIMAPKDKTENSEGAAEPKVSVGKNKDFLKDLTKMMGKSFVPGGPMPKKKETSGFEGEGELFSNATPEGAEKWPMGAERGASRRDGYEAPEEPSKLVGLTRSRPRGPAKRPPTRGVRKEKIQAQSEDFGDFFAEPTESPNLDNGMLFNGAIEDNLFAASTASSHRVKFPASTKPDIETDIFTSGNPNKFKNSTENNAEEELFPASSQVPVKYHSSNVKPEADTKVPPDANQKTEEVPHTLTPPPLELPEDLFASVALPKATKSSKSGTKQKTVPDPIVTKPQAEPDSTDINFEEHSVIKEKQKKTHKVVKRTDEELFGGDDLFGEIPESKPKSKSDKTKKKKANDTTKKTKKVKEFDPSSIDDIFD